MGFTRQGQLLHTHGARAKMPETPPWNRYLRQRLSVFGSYKVCWRNPNAGHGLERLSPESSRKN